MIKILVDADACPVKAQIIKIAKQNKIEVLLYCDTAHRIEDDYATTILVDKGRDSADIKLANSIQNGDLVITQDYGLATMALAKRAYVLNHNGMAYTTDNIDQLLYQRHMSKKARNAGHRMKGPSKRSKEDDLAFEAALVKKLKEVLE